MDLKDRAFLLKSLGDPTRLGILKAIADHGSQICVMKIAELLNVSQPAISQHLKTLKMSGVVEGNREGFHIHYRICLDPLEEVGISEEVFYRIIGSDRLINKECQGGGACQCKD